MSKAITEIDDPRLVKALAHPVRIRIMGIVEQAPATPKQMAAQLDLSIENVSYHVRTLRNLGFIELVRERIVGGAVEHLYRATARPRITAKAWERLPAIVKEAFDKAAVDQIFDLVSRAAAQEKLGRPESHISRQSALLDEQGFAELSDRITALLDDIARIEMRAAERIRDHSDEVPVTVIAMLFDTPDVKPARDQTRRSAARARGDAG